MEKNDKKITGGNGMKNVTRKEKLVAQMENVEMILSNGELTSEQKVFMITQQMSYLNSLVNSMIEPLREEAGETELVKLANSTFNEFLEK